MPGGPPIAVGLVAAAGRGRRVGAGANKVLLPLGGVPILAWTLTALRASPHIGPLVVVVGPGDEEPVEQLRTALGIDFAIVVGGETRAESVRAGLRVCDGLGPELVAVHDGARPFVTEETIARAVRAAAECGASGAALPVSDTVKVVDGEEWVVMTPARGSLRAMQTPQVFRISILQNAYDLAGDRIGEMTDDCEVVERAGYPVQLCAGDPANLKITYDTDWLLAEALAATREKPKKIDPAVEWPRLEGLGSGIA